jgi:hypothetical protein
VFRTNSLNQWNYAFGLEISRRTTESLNARWTENFVGQVTGFHSIDKDKDCHQKEEQSGYNWEQRVIQTRGREAKGAVERQSLTRKS